MKPKHHIPFALLGIPFLLLNPAAHAQDLKNDKIAAEAIDSEKRETEAAESGLDTAENAKDRAKEARQSGQDTAEAARERAKEARESGLDTAENAKERAKEARQSGQDTAEAARERAKETRESGLDTAENAKERANEARQSGLDTAENAKERANEARESGLETVDNVKETTNNEVVEITEPERIAETEVTEVTKEVQTDFDKRKTRIEGRDQAQALINDILGAESRISRAELAREERFRDRFERQRVYEVTPDQRTAATTYYQERLFGREFQGPTPEFFTLSDNRVNGTVVEQVEYVQPRYLNDGRRYVHYDSRSSIPAVLMAAQAMDNVRFQPAQEIAPIFYGRQNVSAPNAMPLPPENYRSKDSWVVSYPVDEKSMISSQDILFRQGTTQFSDPYSYDVVGIMADAMKAMPAEERFVIEGHASSEGSYDSNMVLSQQRAEHIVREIVRRGDISPYRLLPVGYGESEARNPADSAESLLRQDRRVVVFRMKPETVAKR